MTAYSSFKQVLSIFIFVGTDIFLMLPCSAIILLTGSLNNKTCSTNVFFHISYFNERGKNLDYFLCVISRLCLQNIVMNTNFDVL